MTLGDPSYVYVPQVSSGSKIANFAAKTWIDQQDGNGPQLVTVYFQAVSVTPIDANGNPLDPDDIYPGADWKRQLLDELRAVRIGMDRLTSNTRFAFDNDRSLIDVARESRNEAEDDVVGANAGSDVA